MVVTAAAKKMGKGSMRTPAWLITVAGLLLVLTSSFAQIGQPAATALVPGDFEDVTAKVGVDFVHQAPHSSRKYLLETMGSGVALFDYDNDGRLDLYLVNGAPFGDYVPKGTIPQKNGPRYWNSPK